MYHVRFFDVVDNAKLTKKTILKTILQLGNNKHNYFEFLTTILQTRSLKEEKYNTL